VKGGRSKKERGRRGGGDSCAARACCARRVFAGDLAPAGRPREVLVGVTAVERFRMAVMWAWVHWWRGRLRVHPRRGVARRADLLLCRGAGNRCAPCLPLASLVMPPYCHQPECWQGCALASES